MSLSLNSINRIAQITGGEDRKVQYSPLFEFDSAAVCAAFFNAVIHALSAYDPRALECRGAAA